MRLRLERARGMMLAEVLLAMTLLLVVALLLIGLMPTASSAMTKARHHGRATQFCRQEIDRARCAVFADLGDRLTTVSSGETLSGVSAATTYTVQRRVTVVSERLKKVEATVSWSGNGLAYVRLATLVRGEP